MKEYLEKQADGSYKLVMQGIVGKDDDIEVPEGADAAFKKQYGDGLCFFQCVGENGADWCSETKKWISRITIENKSVYLGIFLTEKEAYDKYLQIKETLL